MNEINNLVDVMEKEGLTIGSIGEYVAEQICNNYCKFPNQYEDEEKLFSERCDSCPLNLIN